MFLSLDFLYVPGKPPAAVIDYYTKVLGGTLLFHVKAMSTEVAGVRLSTDGPLVLLAEAGRGLRDPARTLLYVHRQRRPASRHLRADASRRNQSLHGPLRPLTVLIDTPVGHPYN